MTARDGAAAARCRAAGLVLWCAVLALVAGVIAGDAAAGDPSGARLATRPRRAGPSSTAITARRRGSLALARGPGLARDPQLDGGAEPADGALPRAAAGQGPVRRAACARCWTTSAAACPTGRTGSTSTPGTRAGGTGRAPRHPRPAAAGEGAGRSPAVLRADGTVSVADFKLSPDGCAPGLRAVGWRQRLEDLAHPGCRHGHRPSRGAERHEVHVGELVPGRPRLLLQPLSGLADGAGGHDDGRQVAVHFHVPGTPQADDRTDLRRQRITRRGIPTAP